MNQTEDLTRENLLTGKTIQQLMAEAGLPTSAEEV